MEHVSLLLHVLSPQYGKRGLAETVIVAGLLVIEPLCAVMIVIPPLIGVIEPVLSTVATSGLVEFHVRLASIKAEFWSVVVDDTDAPAPLAMRLVVDGVMVIDVRRGAT